MKNSLRQNQETYKVDLGFDCIVFHRDRAAFLPSHSALLISDVHLGKAETFQHFGIAVSSEIHLHDLQRISHLQNRFDARNVWILGDLFHAKWALHENFYQQFIKWRKQFPAEIKLLIGNHDKHIQSSFENWGSLGSWGIKVVGEQAQLGNFLLTHEPIKKPKHFLISGHIHPCFKMKTHLDSIRLPCFVLDADQLILPSFGNFTGGYELQRQKNRTFFLTHDQGIEIIPCT